MLAITKRSARKPFYKLFCAAQRVLGLRLRDLYATKDTYVSTALTRGVNLTWLSEQTGVADSTLRKHYGRFIHADEADALELSKIDSQGSKRYSLPLNCPSEGHSLRKTLYFTREKWWSRRDLNPDESPENLRVFGPKCVPKWPFRYSLPHVGQTPRASTRSASAVPAALPTSV